MIKDIVKKELFNGKAIDADGRILTTCPLDEISVLTSYYYGIFPWGGNPPMWFIPRFRAVFFLQDFSIPKSVKKIMKKEGYKVFIDRECVRVIRECKDAFRASADEAGSWIDEDFIRVYGMLHKKGYVHSLEIWRDKDLIGGLYGICIGRVFCGESMFFKESGMSKVAFFELASFLHKNGFAFIDCQVPNPHLINVLGASILTKEQFDLLLFKFRDDNFLIGSWENLI